MIKYGCKVCNRWFDQADRTDEWLWTDHIRLEDCTLPDKKLGYVTDKVTKITKRINPPKYEDTAKSTGLGVMIRFKNSDGSTSKTDMESY